MNNFGLSGGMLACQQASLLAIRNSVYLSACTYTGLYIHLQKSVLVDLSMSLKIIACSEQIRQYT